MRKKETTTTHTKYSTTSRPVLLQMIKISINCPSLFMAPSFFSTWPYIHLIVQMILRLTMANCSVGRIWKTTPTYTQGPGTGRATFGKYSKPILGSILLLLDDGYRNVHSSSQSTFNSRRTSTALIGNQSPMNRVVCNTKSENENEENRNWYVCIEKKMI